MSVIHFGLEELGNLTRVLKQSTRFGDPQRAVALIAQANARCYAYRYKTEVQPITETELATDLVAGPSPSRVADLKRACETAFLLGYNCQEDRDFLAEEPGGPEALIQVLETLLEVIVERGFIR